ncbi:MAG: methyl-accepting chemotaxis protein [Undibacterium sp.]|uniref:methyl-accepting chemotaxis protein n=1 Tax=Undibacterium sp. TaxID=1914977 RepID=UPI0027180445|nr:methyl-accepting chemotaxis protein [Undibacterium sp.]MDO8651706.1 methyl-accepting chemotaxis protein [Undibacterium sp.]
MKFNTKIISFAAIPAVLFVVGLMSSIGALVNTRDEFEKYIKSEQAVERGLSEMYAQGLQLGQALRNVVLDPSNQKAFDNIKAAQVAYDKAFSSTQAISKGRAFESGIAKLPGLREIHAKAQDKVLALVAEKGDAISVLNKEETPAWRELRAEILKQREAAVKASQVAQQQVDARADLATKVSISIALLAVIVAIGLNLLMQSTIRKELGGDPADAREALSQVSQGNLASRIENLGDANSLMGVMLQMQSSLQKLVQGVRVSANGIATATSEIAAGSQDLSDRTEQQASALEETAASMEELDSTVKKNADSTRQAAQMAMNASSVAVLGGEVVGQVVETMKDINESSRRISDIISVIDGISFQTNILALNAAVEAARAGDQGRGFAVVASEVRSLAGRSAEAAKEIKVLINASVERVEQGVMLVDKAGTTMSEVVNSIRQVTDLMGEINASSAEQSMGVSQVGEAVILMDQTTQQNAALVEEMAAAAASLNNQSNDMVQTVAVFHLPSDLSNPQPQRVGRAQARLSGMRVL